MAKRWQVVLGTAVAGLVVATPLVYSSHRHNHRRNLRVVEEGVLYRSGQLTPVGLERAIKEKEIRTLVTLRMSRVPGKPPPDAWEEDVCSALGVRHVRILPRSWNPTGDGDVDADETVAEFLRVMEDKGNYPVLVHCFAGVHRTGAMVAAYRMEYHRWPPARALDEMVRCGFEYEEVQKPLENFVRNYRPRWTRPGG